VRMEDEKRSHSSCLPTHSNRFGTKSMNMFFSRNAAHPRHLRFITGVGGIQICSIKEDKYSLPVPHKSSETSFSVAFPPNTYNEALLKTYADKLTVKKKKERVLPPIRFWTSSGIIVDDTSKWRNELNHLASSVGLMTANELKTATDNLKEKQKLPNSALLRKSTQSAELVKPSTSEYSRHTGRLNETPKTATATRGRTSYKRLPDYVYCIEDGEREMWMIKVLCQILQTDSMQDIQSWLVSAGQQEKETARELIEHALKGLQESGRIQVDDDGKNNVETQVNLDDIKETIERLSESQQKNRPIVSNAPNPDNIETIREENTETITFEDEFKAEENPNGQTTTTQLEEAKTDMTKYESQKQLNMPIRDSLSILADSKTPVQRILNASILKNADEIKNSPIITKRQMQLKPLLKLTNTKFVSQSYNDIFSGKTNSYGEDFFKTGNNTNVDKKISNKIIKELLSFVELERRDKPFEYAPFESRPIIKKKNDLKPKIRFENMEQKDSQVLTIED